MSKFTKKQVKELYSILSQLKIAEGYILNPSVAVCRKSDMATTTMHYTRQSDKTALVEVQKEIGSELYYLFASRSKLERFVEGGL